MTDLRITTAVQYVATETPTAPHRITTVIGYSAVAYDVRATVALAYVAYETAGRRITAGLAYVAIGQEIQTGDWKIGGQAIPTPQRYFNGPASFAATGWAYGGVYRKHRGTKRVVLIEWEGLTKAEKDLVLQLTGKGGSFTITDHKGVNTQVVRDGSPTVTWYQGWARGAGPIVYDVSIRFKGV